MTHQMTETIPSPPDAAGLLALLGARASLPEVTRLLEQLQLRPDLSKRWSVAVAAPLHGLDLRFCRGGEIAEAAGIAGDEQVLACVFFHAEGHEGHRGFAGALPFGLEFSTSRSQARQALGTPSWSGSRYESDRWSFQRRYLSLDFAKDEASIQLVTVGLPWRVRA